MGCFRNIIEGLLDGMFERFSSAPSHLCAVGAAFRGFLAVLARKGGQTVLFHSSMCSVGPGISEQRVDEMKFYDTDKEKQLFLPHNQMWRELGEELAEEGISVSMFVATGSMAYVDFASIGTLASLALSIVTASLGEPKPSLYRNRRNINRRRYPILPSVRSTT